MFKILNTEKYEKLDIYLNNQGYEKKDITNVMEIDLETQSIYVELENWLQNKKDKNIQINIESEFSDKWFESFVKINNVGENAENAKLMLNNLTVDKYVVSITMNGQIIACGYGAIEENYMGFFDICVDNNFRGNGFGKMLMLGIMQKAKQNKILKGYLQVVSDNVVARNLYSKLGFEKSYEYWYRRK